MLCFLVQACGRHRLPPRAAVRLGKSSSCNWQEVAHGYGLAEARPASGGDFFALAMRLLRTWSLIEHYSPLLHGMGPAGHLVGAQRGHLQHGDGAGQTQQLDTEPRLTYYQVMELCRVTFGIPRRVARWINHALVCACTKCFGGKALAGFLNQV